MNIKNTIIKLISISDIENKMNALETAATEHKLGISSQESQVSSHDRSLDQLININSRQSALISGLQRDVQQLEAEYIQVSEFMQGF